MSKELTTLSPTVAQAAELARNGEYTRATKVLRELGGRDSTDPAVLDLLARIHAQRGELFDADECWALALRLDTDFAAARAGRQRIAALVVRRLRPRTRRVVLTVVLAAVAVTGAGVAGGLLTAQRPGPSPDPAVLAELNDIQNSQREQAQHLGNIDGQLDQTALRQQRILDNLTTAFAGSPGLITRVDAGAVIIAFPAGVYRTDIQLSDTGSAALADLARRLGPFGTDVSITVVGHTDDAQASQGSGYPSNDALGQARAMTAAERMSEASGLPLSTFALSSSGAANPPFPDTTAANRARNRTVTVVVRPR